jgi:hypothetical protein
MGQCSSSSAAVTAQQAHHKPKPTKTAISSSNKPKRRPVVHDSPHVDETMSTTHNEADDFAKRAELDQLQNDISKLEAKAQRYTRSPSRPPQDALQSSWCMMTNSDYSESSISHYRTRDDCSWGQMDTSCVGNGDSSCELRGEPTSRTLDATDREEDDDDWYGGAARRQRYSVRSDRASSCSTMDGSLTIHELEQFNGV